MNITNNFIIISAANRIRRSNENELLTNGIILRRSRKQAKIESTAEHLNTKNKWALIVSKREAERIAKILQGEFSTPYEVIPFTLADNRLPERTNEKQSGIVPHDTMRIERRTEQDER